MITNTTVHRSNVGNRRGWAFSVYFCNRPHPNVASALFTTKREAQSELKRYVETGRLAFYGSAE